MVLNSNKFEYRLALNTDYRTDNPNSALCEFLFNNEDAILSTPYKYNKNDFYGFTLWKESKYGRKCCKLFNSRDSFSFEKTKRIVFEFTNDREFSEKLSTWIFLNIYKYA